MDEAGKDHGLVEDGKENGMVFAFRGRQAFADHGEDVVGTVSEHGGDVLEFRCLLDAWQHVFQFFVFHAHKAFLQCVVDRIEFRN